MVVSDCLALPRADSGSDPTLSPRGPQWNGAIVAHLHRLSWPPSSRFHFFPPLEITPKRPTCTQIFVSESLLGSPAGERM